MRMNPALPVVMAVAAWVALVATSSFTQAQEIERLEVIDSGFYTAKKTGETKAAPGSAAGADQILSNVEFLTDAPKDRALVGTQFGIRFRSVGEPQNSQVTLRSVWRIPEPGITNPKTGKTFRESVVNFPHVLGTSHVRGYAFDESWEVARGIWTLQIWYGDRKLIERSFIIE